MGSGSRQLNILPGDDGSVVVDGRLHVDGLTLSHSVIETRQAGTNLFLACAPKAECVDKICCDRGTFQIDHCECDYGFSGLECEVICASKSCCGNGDMIYGECVCHQGYTGT